VDWIPGTLSLNNAVSAGVTSGLSLTAVATTEKYTNPVLQRIVGQVGVVPGDQFDSTDEIVGAWGIIVTPDVTLTLSDYDPALELEKSWVMWKPFHITGHMFHFVQDWELNIPVKRRLNNEQQLQFVITNTASSTVPLEYGIGCRILLSE